MSREQSFSLDGNRVPFREGETIMDAALRAGAYIPHLCHHPEFTPMGSCRLCIVNVNGRTVSACTHPAKDGTEVENDADSLVQQRRTLLQMLFVEGNHVCPGCQKSGDCELQAVAYYCEMLSPHFTHFFPRRSIDASHPEFIIDFNRCILCELCVRASRDVDEKSVFEISGRGIQSRLTINSSSGKLGDSTFKAEDRAASICPVGAILPRQQAYRQPIGGRRYDRSPINTLPQSRTRKSSEEAG